MRRDAARSAGPMLMPCMRGLAAAISSTFATPSAVSRIAWTRIGRSRRARPPPRAGGGGERWGLGEEAVDVVDVPRALDLRDHDDLEALADLGHERRDVVEGPRRFERVDPRPERAVAAGGLAPGPSRPL